MLRLVRQTFTDVSEVFADFIIRTRDSRFQIRHRENMYLTS
jgi:hypothetical protein